MSGINYYYIYGAMTQTIGALVALIGIFIVYRLESEKNKIENLYENVREHIGITATMGLTRREIEEKMLMKIRDNSDVELMQRNQDLKRSRNILEYTIKIGKFTMFYTILLFIYFITALHLHTIFPIFRLRGLVFGFVFSIIAACGIMYFLMNSINPQRLIEWIKTFWRK